MCIVENSFRKPKCEEKEYFPSDSINMFKKFALASNKQDVLDKYERLRKQDTKYDIGDEIFVYKIGDEWHLSSIDDEDQREELDEKETEKINVLMRNKATGYPSGNMTITTPSYETHHVDDTDDDTDDDDNYDELGGKRRRRRFTRRKVRKTLARKSRRSKHLNKKRQKKTRRKHRKR